MKRADRKGYPTDVSDEEWSFAAPYLTLMDVTAPQRKRAAAVAKPRVASRQSASTFNAAISAMREAKVAPMRNKAAAKKKVRSDK